MRKSTTLATPQRVVFRRSDAAFSSSSIRGASGGYRMSVGRQSILESVRRSSATREGRRERLPADKNSHMKNYQSLIGFLTESGYNVPLNTFRLQGLQCSTKEVINIVQFLLGFICPDYPPIKKFDEDFPVLMKVLKYPYGISKRQLQPVGSAHNWPYIIHALSWLAIVAKYHQTLEAHPFSVQPDALESIAKSAALKINLEAYKLFMSGEDEDRIKARDEEFLANELEQFEGLGGDEAAQMEELEAKLKETLDKLEIETEKERELDNQLSVNQTDLQKIKTYMEESKEYISHLKVAIGEAQEKRDNNAKLVEQLERELKEKKELVANQKYTAFDVQQKKVQISHLQSQCTTNKANLEEAVKEMNDLELDLLNKKEKIKNVIEEYHRLAYNCKIIPSTAENAQGYDYSVFLQNPESDASPSNVHDLNGRLKLILKRWKEANREECAAEMKLMEDVQRMKNILTSKSNEYIEINSKVLRHEELLMFKEQEFKKSNQDLVTNLAILEEQIAELKTVAESTNVEALEIKISELRSKYKMMKDGADKREKEFKECFLDMLEVFLEFREDIQNTVSDVTNHVKKWDEDRRHPESQFNKNQKAIEELREKALLLKAESDATTEELMKFKVIQ